MLRRIQQIHGYKLGATDGEIGYVNDVYFDDQHWAIRYLVADTGSWIPGRLVLISPHAFGSFPPDGKVVPVNLTRQQIESCPAIESHQPVSRRYEEEYYQYYGWPYYWQGNAVWGMSGFPILSEKSEPYAGEPSTVNSDSDDVHLRSARSLVDYEIQNRGDILGRLADFIFDDQSWVITQLAVRTGSRIGGQELFLAPSAVNRISWEESKIFTNATRESASGIAS